MSGLWFISSELLQLHRFLSVPH